MAGISGMAAAISCRQRSPVAQGNRSRHRWWHAGRSRHRHSRSASMPKAGLVAAACDRADFPSEIDQLLLSVAANHAATAFRMARLVDDHRRAEAALRESERQLRKARDELETKVAERTAELQRSEAYLAEAQRLSHTGSFGWDVFSGKLYWSEETFRIFECDPATKVTIDIVSTGCIRTTWRLCGR